MNYMRRLQDILLRRDGVTGTSLDIMLGHVRPSEERIDDIYDAWGRVLEEESSTRTSIVDISDNDLIRELAERGVYVQEISIIHYICKTCLKTFLGNFKEAKNHKKELSEHRIERWGLFGTLELENKEGDLYDR